MIVVVSGGAGFLGYHLCKRLLEDGHEVHCLDNLVTGSMKNIKLLQKYPGFTFENINICFINHKLLGHIQFDRIYHLASIASPKQYTKRPFETMDVGYIGTRNMLELARNHNARILFTSTSEVYGDPTESPQAETYNGNVNPIGPRACYDESKRIAETMMFEYNRRFGVDIKVVRIFNTYGPNMAIDDGRVVSNFITSALKGESLPVYGNGWQTRTLCYVDDTIDHMMTVMEDSKDLGPYNIGGDHEISIMQLARLVCELCDRPTTIELFDGMQDDPKCRVPDLSKIYTLLDERDFGKTEGELKGPRLTPLRDGLLRTIEFFKSQLQLN